jgi:hypothetical protein
MSVKNSGLSILTDRARERDKREEDFLRRPAEIEKRGAAIWDKINREYY